MLRVTSVCRTEKLTLARAIEIWPLPPPISTTVPLRRCQGKFSLNSTVLFSTVGSVVSYTASGVETQILTPSIRSHCFGESMSLVGVLGVVFKYREAMPRMKRAVYLVSLVRGRFETDAGFGCRLQHFIEPATSGQGDYQFSRDDRS